MIAFRRRIGGLADLIDQAATMAALPLTPDESHNGSDDRNRAADAQQ